MKPSEKRRIIGSRMRTGTGTAVRRICAYFVSTLKRDGEVLSYELSTSVSHMQLLR